LRNWILQIGGIAVIVSAFSLLFMILESPIVDPLFSIADDLSEMGVSGVFLYALLFAILATFMIPSSLMKLLAGAVFGFGWGSLAGWLGSMIGAIIPFIIAKHWLSDWAKNKINQFPTVEAIEQAVIQQGIKTVVLLRLSLILPYNLLNYILGPTRLKTSDYLIGNVATIGPSILYAWWGSQLASVAKIASGGDEREGLWWIAMIISLLLTIWLIMQTRKLAITHLEEQKVPFGTIFESE